MVDLAKEQLLTLQQLADRLPFSYGTLHKWSIRGHRGVKLEVCKFPGKRLTSLEAVQRFVDQLAALDGPAPRVKPDRNEAVRRALREEHGL